MHEPISVVPNTSAIAWTFPKIAWVAKNADATEMKIANTDAKIGIGLLKTKMRIAITIIIETAEMTVISFCAFVELLWLWNGVPKNAKRVPSVSSGRHAL